MKHYARDRKFKMRILERDGACIACGESNPFTLCAHHLITRANLVVRWDPRNAVTVCNAPRARMVDGIGVVTVPCHHLAEDLREWFEGLAIRHLISHGFFESMDEAIRFYGAAKSSQPITPNPWA